MGHPHRRDIAPWVCKRPGVASWGRLQVHLGPRQPGRPSRRRPHAPPPSRRGRTPGQPDLRQHPGLAAGTVGCCRAQQRLPADAAAIGRLRNGSRRSRPPRTRRPLGRRRPRSSSPPASAASPATSSSSISPQPSSWRSSPNPWLPSCFSAAPLMPTPPKSPPSPSASSPSAWPDTPPSKSSCAASSPCRTPARPSPSPRLP